MLINNKGWIKIKKNKELANASIIWSRSLYDLDSLDIMKLLDIIFRS